MKNSTNTSSRWEKHSLSEWTDKIDGTVIKLTNNSENNEIILTCHEYGGAIGINTNKKIHYSYETDLEFFIDKKLYYISKDLTGVSTFSNTKT